MSDAVAIQIVTTLGTIATVLITGWQNRRTTREKADETHKKLETINNRVSGEFFPLRDTPLSVDVVNDRPANRPPQ